MFNRKYILDFGSPYQPELPQNNYLFYEQIDAGNVRVSAPDGQASLASQKKRLSATEIYSERVSGELEDEIYVNDFGRRIRNLNVAFEIEKNDQLTSSKCEITVYNLSDASLAILEANRGLKTFIRLRAGYDSDVGPLDLDEDILLRSASDLNGREDTSIPNGVIEIFKGVVESYDSSWDGVDRITRLTCSDAPEFAWAVSAHEFPKGTQYRYIVDVLLRDLGMPREVIDEIPDWYVTQRPVYLYGKTSDLLLQLGNSWGFQFSVADLQMYITQKGKEVATRGWAPVISPATGLIGRVEPVEDNSNSSGANKIRVGSGVKFTTLLNGRILPQQPILLQTDQVVGSTRVEGFYRVVKVTHKGEYEGQDWYSEVEAERASDQYSLIEISRDVPLSGRFQGPEGAA